ncbi:MAG: hypothetical protein F6K18_05810 [Okeania sp. SIO2C2]|uniref:hypothetical protein n=1 Tax=Okeania sp. SIO2C2 TaxID=2607787 RepID=UPI0013BBD922|nr:hypothetical protein [Okeania sp. SIO2C2]NEP86375.1 hypothetical protein [Okeania sp. SIO2C2]
MQQSLIEEELKELIHCLIRALYQIRLNSHRMVKLGVLRSQETVLRRRKNYKDEGSYDD